MSSVVKISVSMGLEITRPLGVGGINPNIYASRYVNFGSNQDTFEIRSNARYTTEPAIRRMIMANPKIKNIVRTFNPEMNLNMQELKELLQNHAADTKNITDGIVENLPFALKTRVDTKALDDASYLHDLGKVLIPSEILNKPGKLSEKETEIMHKHSELSYELLKSTGLDNKTLNLIRNHHQNMKKTGYPWVSKDFNVDLNLQILSAADKYSALTEKRVYKEPMSPKEALTIIYQDVKDGKLSPFVFKALADYAANVTPLNAPDIAKI